MNVQLIRRQQVPPSADCYAIGVFDEPTSPDDASGESPLGGLLSRLRTAKELGTAVGDTTPLLGLADAPAKTVLAFGLGPRDRFDAGAAYSAGVAVARRLSGKPRETVAVALPDAGTPDAMAVASAMVEGLVVGTRGPGLRKGEPGRHPFGPLLTPAPEGAAGRVDGLERAVRRGQVVGEAINLSRDMVNTPPSEKTPPVLAEAMRAIADGAGLEVEVWDLARIKAERMGGILGVSAGSEEPPAFLKLAHRKAGDAPTLAL